MEIRFALPTDADELEELEIALFRDNCFNATTLRRELEAGLGLVAVDDTYGIVGYLIASIEGRLVDVLRLGILPRFRRKGLGRRLLNMAIEQWPEAMLTVRRDNRKAIRLYLDSGFHIIGRLSTDSWVMKRTTSAST